MAGLPQFSDTVSHVTRALEGSSHRFAIVNATKIDASGITPGFWLVADEHGVICATGSSSSAVADSNGASPAMVPGFVAACRKVGIDPADSTHVTDAEGQLVVPGYIDIHAHGGWGASFDDGPAGVDVARAAHAWHGTTRQVCSLITNPLDVMERNIRVIREKMRTRPDILGSHLEGPFLSPQRKGAHDPACLKDPKLEYVDQLLNAADGTIRQITLAPELAGGIDAVRHLAEQEVIPAVGHTQADYATARLAFQAGARLLTHLFNAMNGLHHRAPGPIPAAVEDPRVMIELINDGFHVQNPMVSLGFSFAPHRTVFVTDAMSATGCPDGQYKLGELDVQVKDSHARLISNGAIAGSTLVLEKAVSRAVRVLGISPVDAVEAATAVPARVFGLDRPNSLTTAPLGLIQPSYAADVLLLDPLTWDVESVWCAGRCVRS